MQTQGVNYINGGKLGDFIHLLWVAYRKYQLLGQTANIYITGNQQLGGDAFSRSTEQTYHELIPILKQQKYIQNFRFLDALPTEQQIHLLQQEHVNLNAWRSNVPLILEWLQLLSTTYRLPLAPITGAWLTWKPRNPKYANKVVIHKNLIRADAPGFPWDTILCHNDCVFITCDPKEADAWKTKYPTVPVEMQETLTDMFTAIASAKFFIGNQSSPLTIASALGKPCLAELDDCCAFMYMHTKLCSGEMFWYLSPEKQSMKGIEKYLNIAI